MPRTNPFPAMTPLRGLIVGVCTPFLVSGVMKLSDLSLTTQEMSDLGLRYPYVMALLVVVVQLAGSILAIFCRGTVAALGALALAGFTVVATLLAHAFWMFDGAARIAEINTFSEHLSITFALLMVAWGHANSVQFAARKYWATQKSGHFPNQESS